MAQHFQAYEGQPLTIPAEVAGPKSEYLAWHRAEVFGKWKIPEGHTLDL